MVLSTTHSSVYAARRGAYRSFLLTGVGALVLALAACSELPRDAPTGDAIRGAATVSVAPLGERVPYAYVSLSPSIVETVNDDKTVSGDLRALSRLPRGGAGAAVPIAIGDDLSVTIFEAQAGGLFIPNDAGSRSGNFVALPTQQVDNSGFITVPYVGNLKVAGLTARQASNIIAEKLKTRAIEPQVIISTTERHGNQVSVLGEVNSPARFGLDPGGVRLSGAIAKAGGPKFPDYDTAFTLERHGVSYRATLSSVFLDSKLDIQLQPDDVVYLAHDPRFVMVFGATLDPTLTSITRRVTFESAKMNLTEAIAKAGGLNTARADARSVFVFRKEPKVTLARLGVDTSAYTSDEVPTVFSVNLASADGFFLGDSFRLHNRDIIVVSDAAYADFAKFFALLDSAASVPISGASLGLAAHN